VNRRLAGELRAREECERVEPVVDGDDDDSLCGQIGSVVARFGSGADDEAATVNPHHDRGGYFGVQSRRPDVEVETILGNPCRIGVDVVENDALHRIRSEGVRRSDAGPMSNRLWRLPPEVPDRRSGIGDPLEAADA